MRDGRLYVAQQNQKSHPYYGGIIFLGTTNAATGNGGTEPSQALTVSVYDLKKLPEVSLLGKTTAAVDFNSYSTTRLQASWPAPGILVWTRPQNYRPWWRWYVTMDMPSLNPPPAITLFADTRVAVNNFAAQSDTAATLGFAATDSIAIHPYPRGDEGGIEGAVFDVSSPNAPLLASKLEIRTGATTDWSEVFTSEGKLYVSSMAQPEIVIAKENPEAAGSLIPKEVPRAGRHFMKVVSFDGPTKPTISAEINIPGRLVGVARFGALLFTNGPRYSAQLIPTQERAIHASSFDGTSVRFLDQIPFSGGSFAMDGETTLINLPGTAEPALKPTVQLWRLNAEDKFQLESTITTEVYANLAVIQGIAIVGFNPTQHLYNVSDPANPVDLGVLKNFGWSSLTPQNSVAEPARGVWGASGDYGVSFKEFNQ